MERWDAEERRDETFTLNWMPEKDETNKTSTSNGMLPRDETSARDKTPARIVTVA